MMKFYVDLVSARKRRISAKRRSRESGSVSSLRSARRSACSSLAPIRPPLGLRTRQKIDETNERAKTISPAHLLSMWSPSSSTCFILPAQFFLFLFIYNTCPLSCSSGIHPYYAFIAQYSHCTKLVLYITPFHASVTQVPYICLLTKLCVVVMWLTRYVSPINDTNLSSLCSIRKDRERPFVQPGVQFDKKMMQTSSAACCHWSPWTTRSQMQML